MTSLVKIKNNQGRGDFFFRDVYQRNTFCAFTGENYSDASTVYITAEEQAVNCTSQISTYANGIGTLHVYTRDGEEFDKSNTARATMSANSWVTTFRSANTNVNGGFTVKGNLFTVNPSTTRVGINQTSPGYTLDVNGDCNLRGNLRVHGNVVSFSANTASTTFQTTAPFLYNGPGESYDNGVPFGNVTQSSGPAFVTPGETNKNVFTFAAAGTYLVQAELTGGFPWLPEGGEVSSYFVHNASTKLGYETQTLAGASGAYHCSKSYVLTASANDNLAFQVDSSVSNQFVAGFEQSRIRFVNLTVLGSHTDSSSSPTYDNITVQNTACVLGNVEANVVRSTSGNLAIEAQQHVVSSTIYNSTTAVGPSVSITGTPGVLQRVTSSRRYKTDIQTLDEAYSRNIYELRPVWYRSLCPSDRHDWGWYGLVAEEVAAVDPRLCFWGTDGRVEGVMYDRIVPLLLTEHRRTAAHVEELQDEIQRLKQDLRDIVSKFSL